MVKRTVARIAFAFLAISSIAFAQTSFKYVSINFPGAFSTQANGINNGGEIVGTYLKTICSGSCATHGFKYVNGKYTTINFPGAFSTSVNGVNDYGDIVGSYITSADAAITHGFLLLHTGHFETLDLTGVSQSNTTPLAVNKYLTVVGSYIDDSSAGVGFIWKNGSFTKVDLGGGAVQESLNGVSNPGLMVGFFSRNGQPHIFVKSGTDVDVLPNTRSKAGTMESGGVNGRGDVVGVVFGHAAFYSARVERGESSNDHPEPTFHSVELNFPGAAQTGPSAINYNRAIVGTYQKSDHVSHGFLAVPQ
jgi:hypothetical protein